MVTGAVLVPLTGKCVAQATMQPLLNRGASAANYTLRHPWGRDTLPRRPATALVTAEQSRVRELRLQGQAVRQASDSDLLLSAPLVSPRIRQRPDSAAPVMMGAAYRGGTAMALAEPRESCTCGCKELQDALGTVIGCSCKPSIASLRRMRQSRRAVSSAPPQRSRVQPRAQPRARPATAGAQRQPGPAEAALSKSEQLEQLMACKLSEVEGKRGILGKRREEREAQTTHTTRKAECKHALACAPGLTRHS